jgi:hypothetical protein
MAVGQRYVLSPFLAAFELQRPTAQTISIRRRKTLGSVTACRASLVEGGSIRHPPAQVWLSDIFAIFAWVQDARGAAPLAAATFVPECPSRSIGHSRIRASCETSTKLFSGPRKSAVTLCAGVRLASGQRAAALHIKQRLAHDAHRGTSRRRPWSAPAPVRHAARRTTP